MMCVFLDVWDSDKCGCLSGCVGLAHVLCVCLDAWDPDKCCLFVFLFTVSVPSPGCVGLGHVLCVCLDVWVSDKCYVFF